VKEEALFEAFADARAATLAFVEGLDDEALCAQPDPAFSPIAWHLGHAAFTEAQWVFGRLDGDDRYWREHHRRWAQDGCGKAERVEQPPREELLAFVAEVREAVTERLRAATPFDPGHPLLTEGYLLWFLTAHEHQHRETIALVRQLTLEQRLAVEPPPPPAPAAVPERAFVAHRSGPRQIGTDARLAYDNERRRHPVEVPAFELGATPVTVAEWEAFRADGGYVRAELWRPEGWRWRREEAVEAPRGWTRGPDGSLARPRLDGRLHPLDPAEPVVGIAHHEAEAFAAWAGARLPTEQEWEAAAQGQPSQGAVLGLESTGPRPVAAGRDGVFGQVWQWTDSRFAPYPGFAPFPYRGYSAPYFDGVHRVLRGVASSRTRPSPAAPSGTGSSPG
jgi:iron(II)-dependent oxidoreductase